jgi:DNA-binding transcriptional ArsR family regulator
MKPLAKLFGSPARLKALRLFVFNRQTAFPLAEIAQRTKLSKETVRRELVTLLAADLIRKKGEGANMRYQTNPNFEHLEALETFIRNTTNMRPDRMVEFLRRAGSLRLVALSGLFMNVSESRVDLLVVGDRLSERTLTNAVRSLEAEIGREIRYASFSTEDFRYRFGVYDRLLRDVFDYPHRLLIDKIGL